MSRFEEEEDVSIVRFLPWKTTIAAGGTSLQCSNSGKKKEKKEKSPSNEDSGNSFPFVASFNMNDNLGRRPRSSKSSKNRKIPSKKNKKVQEALPVMTITSSHRIIGVVEESRSKRNPSDSSSHGNNGSSICPSWCLKESSKYQIRNRPGAKTSFLNATDTTNTTTTVPNGSKKRKSTSSKTSDSPTSTANKSIPALVVEYPNSLVFALENQNSTLVCWNVADTTGGGNRTTIELDSPAMDMAILASNETATVLYGTCQDGKLYMVTATAKSTDQSNDSIVLNVVYRDEHAQQLKQLKNQTNQPFRHVGTFAKEAATITDSNDQGKGACSANCILNQMYCHNSCIILIEHKLTLVVQQQTNDSDMTATATKSKTRMCKIPLKHDPKTTLMQDIFFFSNDANDTITIVYGMLIKSTNRSNNDHNTVHYYCTCIALETPAMNRTPFAVHQQQQMGSVANVEMGLLLDTILCVLDNNTKTILLFDIKYGILLHQESILDILFHSVSSNKRRRIGLLFVDNDSEEKTKNSNGLLQVAVTNIIIPERRSKQHQREDLFHLSARLKHYYSNAPGLKIDEESNISSSISNYIKVILPSTRTKKRNLLQLLGENSKETNDEKEKKKLKLADEASKVEEVVHQALSNLQSLPQDIVRMSTEDKAVKGNVIKCFSSAVSMVRDVMNQRQGKKGSKDDEEDVEKHGVGKKAKEGEEKKAEEDILHKYNPQDATHTAGSKKRDNNSKQRINGFHYPATNPSETTIDDSDVVRKYLRKRELQIRLLSSLPQSFLDGCFTIMLQVLLALSRREKKDSKGKAIGSSTVYQEIGIIIGRLLSTERISARVHFSDNNNNDENVLISILKILSVTKYDHFSHENTKNAGKHGKNDNNIKYSSIDLTYDLLHYCHDLSEYHLVTLVYFYFCYTHPTDTANYFLCDNEDYHHTTTSKKSKPTKTQNNSTTSLRTLSYKYLNLLLEDGGQKHNKKDNGKITKKLILMSGIRLLEQVVLYSSCNETLLRKAIRDILIDNASHQEASSQLPNILVRLFAKLLVTGSTSNNLANSFHDHRRNRCATTTTTLWLSALCDMFNHQLVHTNNSSDKKRDGNKKNNIVSFVNEHIALAIQQTENIITLEEILKLFEDPLSAPFNTDNDATGDSEKSAALTEELEELEVEEDELPEYSIERISLF